MKKRFFSSTALIVILALLITAMVLPAAAEKAASTTPALSISSNVATAKPGDTVTYTVSISGSYTGLRSLQFKVLVPTDIFASFETSISVGTAAGGALAGIKADHEDTEQTFAYSKNQSTSAVAAAAYWQTGYTGTVSGPLMTITGVLKSSGLTAGADTGVKFDTAYSNSFSTGSSSSNFSLTDSDVDVVVNIPAASGSISVPITAPETGYTPQTTLAASTYYAASTIEWFSGALPGQSGSTAHTGAFVADTVYYAKVTLNAKSGYVFAGSYTAASITGTNGTVSDIAVNEDGSALSFNVTYPKTSVKNIVFTAPVMLNAPYNGKAQSLVKTAPVVTTPSSGATVYYSLTNNGTDWSTTIPTATNAGEYTVYVKITAPTYITKTASYTANITKIDLPNFAVRMDDFTLTDTATSPVVTGNLGNGAVTFTYLKSDGTTPTTTDDGASAAGGKPTKAGSYYVKADVAETTNYKAATAKDGFKIVDNGQLAPENLTATLGGNGTYFTVTLNSTVSGLEYLCDTDNDGKIDDETWQKSNVFGTSYKWTTATGSRTFYARRAATSTLVASPAVSVTVTFAVIQNTTIPVLNVTKTGTSGNWTITADYVAGAEYKFDNGEWGSTRTWRSNATAGSAMVYMRIKATATHTASIEVHALVDFNTPADPSLQTQPTPNVFTLTLTLNSDGKTYTATIPVPTNTPAGATPEYSFDGSNWSTTVRTKTNVKPGETVTGYVRFQARSGYAASAVRTASATAPKLSTSFPFVDVKPVDWFYGDVYYVWYNDLMNGIDSTHFAPTGKTSRAMLVTILYRLEGSPAVFGYPTFPDVPRNQYYSDAIVWATQNGITNGYDNGYFGLNDYVTREQLAIFLYRYASYKGYDVTASGVLSKFVDSDKIADSAEVAMKWAVGAGIINGKDGNVLDPTGTAMRCEIAAMIRRFCLYYI